VQATPLALIEPNAQSMGGHHYPALLALVRAASRRGIPVTFVCVKGISRSGREAVEAAGAEVLAGPRGVGRLLALAGNLLERLSKLRHRTPEWGVPYQWEIAGRCLLEAASLRIAPAEAGCVILTAGERLHGTAAVLAGVPHVRVVHDTATREGPVLSRVERRLRHGRKRVLASCTTEAVRRELEELYPDLPTAVHPFTIADPEAYIDERERGEARAALGLGGDELVAAIVGGWWRTKDMATVEVALARTAHPVAAIVAGWPVDREALERIRSTVTGRLLALDRELEAEEIRRVYAACDVTVVSRFAGVGKESGLVMDAARYGVPLVASDHDPTLTAKLDGRPWARLYTAQDPDALAAALDAVAERPLQRPSPDDARELGMLTPEEAVELYAELAQSQPRRRK
jgi:glycosyltransferase involved in cell wall biosynthesis